jgi:hypothetical protein
VDVGTECSSFVDNNVIESGILFEVDIGHRHGIATREGLGHRVEVDIARGSYRTTMLKLAVPKESLNAGFDTAPDR